MPYHLLTGATGLLGTYLLRDLLRAGRQVAVVVRPGRLESARQRIESILAGWEQKCRRVLPRVPVLEGDICEPKLGLDGTGTDWVARHCDSVIHNAASLSFEADEKTGEPQRSNVEGTRNVLDLCRQTGIRQFHHVSTAYVCGLRMGRVLEDELDVGQQPGNAYEASKIEAEKLVRGASFLDAPTVYRPAIIIGDSRTGYTTTYHGFYTPIKVVQSLAGRMQFSRIDASPFLHLLGLTGSDRKNFVPVDWVSSVITYLSGMPQHRGRTYHLTPARPVTVETTCKAVEIAMQEYVEAEQETKAGLPEWDELHRLVIGQMETYRSYWRDDPEFDCRNTRAAAPQLECPEVDLSMLLTTARYALKTNFGWPRPQPLVPEFDVLGYLQGRLPVQDECRGVDESRIGLQVNGPGGGQWTLIVDDGRPVVIEQGLTGRTHELIYLNSHSFRRCALGELSVDEAWQRGQLVIESERSTANEVLGVLQVMLAGSGRVGSGVLQTAT
jgi:thioester reductase-like protein